jgi:hypothetical protein
MMDVNLGWCEGSGDGYLGNRTLKIRVTQTGVDHPAQREFTITQAAAPTMRGNNPFYQWGRKDPVRPSTGFSNFEKELWWGRDYEAYKTTDYKVTGQATLQEAIQNPHLIYHSAALNWTSSGNYYNLWDADNNSNGVSSLSDYRSVKTVYDPCPVGFKVPVPDVWSNFSIDNSTVGGNDMPGRTFTNAGDKSDFPASGRHYNAQWDLSEVGTIGGYWSALPALSSASYCLLFNLTTAPNAVNVTSNVSRNYGYSVRPVLDE